MEITELGRHVGLYHFGLMVGDSDDDLRKAVLAPTPTARPLVSPALRTA